MKRLLLASIAITIVFVIYNNNRLNVNRSTHYPAYSTSPIGSKAPYKKPKKKPTTKKQHKASTEANYRPAINQEFFKKTRAVWAKSILTKKELIEHRKMLQDPELLNEMQTQLTKPNLKEWIASNNLPPKSSLQVGGTSIDTKTEFLLRMDYVKFLNDSVKWEENPAKLKALAVIEHVITDQTWLASTDEEREILKGDKLELFSILKLSAPERAEALVLSSTDELRELLRKANETRGILN